MAVAFDQRASAPWAFPLIGTLALVGGTIGTIVWPGLDSIGDHIGCFFLCAIVTLLFPVTWLIAWILDRTIRPLWERRKAGHPN